MTKPPKVTRENQSYRLEASLWLPVTPEELFPFFADAYNLERLTPAYLNFEVRTPRPIEMRAGTLIDYRLRVRGVPVWWRTEITEWDPPHRFADNQLKGPYKLWYHTHTFEAKEGGTTCRDVVEYFPPGGPLAPLINRLVIQRDVEAIFGYRERVLRSLYDPQTGATNSAIPPVLK